MNRTRQSTLAFAVSTSIAILCSSTAYSALSVSSITEDFEGQTAGGWTVPSGWTAVGGDNVYQTSSGGGGSDGEGGNSGLAGTISTNTTNTENNLPLAYLKSNDSISSSTIIQGSADLYVQGKNVNDFTFTLGNIEGTSAGDSITAHIFDTDDIDKKPTIVLADADNNELLRASFTPVANWSWQQLSFAWTPTSETKGTFSITLKELADGTVVFSHTINDFEFNDSEINFAFGTAAGGVTAQFDNINITSTAVPEPSSAALLSIFGTAALLRRKRSR